MPDLSVLIAARHEQFLTRTIEEVLAKARGDTDVIAVLDGGWADPPVPDHPRVELIYRPAAIGQRAAVNLAARVSRAQYVLKLDAHCALADGFDVALIQADQELGRPDLTQIPAMINLHAFNWRCLACGRETYQGPQPRRCEAQPDHDRELALMPPPCGQAAGFDQVLIWEPRQRRAKGNGSTGAGGLARSEFWRVDHNLEFKYRGPRVNGESEHADVADVMSSVGACFFMRRDRFVEIGGLDEGFGGWGAFGCEIALKSWLSGGRHVVNRRTWFSHLFRTQGKGFSFPYALHPSDQEYAKRYSQNLWYGNLWEGQTRPLSWLIDHFWPIRGWSDPEGAERLAFVRDRGKVFAPCALLRLPLVGPGASQALPIAEAADAFAVNTHPLTIGPRDHCGGMIAATVNPPHTPSVFGVADHFQMSGVNAVAHSTDVVDLEIGVQRNRLNKP